jgi:alpha-tubulin suppressor-like RCC1 family protein
MTRDLTTDEWRSTARTLAGARQVLATGCALALAVSLATSARAATVQVAAGFEHTCSVESTGAARCWGVNDSGQLGDGTTTDRTTPADVAGLSSGVAAVGAGDGHSCALTVAGGVKCWGANGAGQLGDGTTTDRLTPVSVVGLGAGVAAIALGAAHSCALTTAGAVRCWGSNFDGQVGDSTTWQPALTWERPLPVAVVGLASGVAAITAGESHTCALTTAGGAKCWGNNASGRLGNGLGDDSRVPVMDVVGLGSGVLALAAGGGHTCALTNSGTVRCWGSNAFGALGDETTTSRRTPVTVQGLTASALGITAGEDHACAVLSSGSVQCWGHDDDGELGGSGSGKPGKPVLVERAAGAVRSISAGFGHTCALSESGTVTCWGDGR